MSISGAIASSSTGRGPRGSISVVSYRRPSQGRSPSDMSSSTGKTPDDKKKDQKDGQTSGSGSKSKSFCILLVATAIVVGTILVMTTDDMYDMFYGDG